MIKKYTIYGERCSGTNYLENLININFDVEITWEYGWKHFFGFLDDKLKNSDDTLFICIVRNLPDWINSFYREQQHLPEFLKTDINTFLNNQFYSVADSWANKQYYKDNYKILGEDRNIYTGKRYKNIFQLRHTKINWMLKDLPKKVKNCIFIKYEDLINDFDNTLLKIKNKGLKIKPNIQFPLNTKDYKNTKDQIFKKKKNSISTEFILSNPNLKPFYEKKLYNMVIKRYN